MTKLATINSLFFNQTSQGVITYMYLYCTSKQKIDNCRKIATYIEHR